MSDSNIASTPIGEPEPAAWRVIEFMFSNRDTDSELVVMCKGKRFIIFLFAENFSASSQLKEKYLFFLQVAEEFELDGFTVEDFYFWAVEPFFPIFQKLPVLPREHQSTLHDFFYPETFSYTLRAVAEELVPELYEDDGASHGLGFGITVANELCAPWTSFSPSQVLVCQVRTVGPPSQTPSRVVLPDGSTAFLKLARRGDEHSLKIELETYRKIEEAQLDDNIRVSRLHGLVQDESGQVLGLFLTYIDCRRLTLSCAVKPDTPTALREKWMAQLQGSVGELHKAGVFWGDVKPDNVLIDSNQDAWVVDFGGGYTEGWVPRELTGTMDGDRLGLEKIAEFIGN
ncbi:hypothetical protein FDECE_3657 [Fusarium decemcellulare]|nr:hypothetical protein FDECE_3657 [Fusarium decemcellulare]